MTAERRYLNLSAYLRNAGYHQAPWRVSSADPASVLDPRLTHSGRSAASLAGGLR